MIYISKEAKAKVLELFQKDNLGPDNFIRISVQGGGCSGLSYDIKFDTEVMSEDQFFDQDGIRLCTDLKSFLYVCNSTLEYSEGLNGKGFHFTNPNAARTCACGESFSV